MVRLLSFTNEDTTIEPSFANVIRPLSNSLSKSALSRIPLSGLNLSSFSETDHGLIWLAIKSLDKSIPVTTHLPSYFSNNDFLNFPCPILDFISAYFSVLVISVFASMESTISSSLVSTPSIVSKTKYRYCLRPLLYIRFPF